MRKFTGCMLALAFGLVVSISSACPGDGDSAKKTELTSQKGGCSKDCDKPCCAKKAQLTAKKKGCCGKKAALTKSDDGGCPIGKKINAMLTSMPSMKYRVGDEVTGCSKSAEAMATKGGTLQYVVGDENFASKGEAMVKLTALIEAEVVKMQTVQFVAGGKCHACPMTAKNIAKANKAKIAYRVGGVDFESKDTASAVLVSIKKATSDMSLAYKVDGKTYKCSKTAGAKCKASKAKLTYLIGDEETGCETTAKLKNAERKYRKIVETAVTKSFTL